MTQANIDALTEALLAEKNKNALLEKELKETRKKIRHNTWIEEPSENQPFDPEPYGSSTMIQTPVQSTNELSMLTSMSFASLQVSTCTPKEGEEVDKKSFERWKEQLEAAMKFAGIFNENMKMNAFKMKAGYSLLDTLEATSPNDSSSDAQLFPYTNAMERLHKYYSSHDYVFLQRQKLRSMNQNDGESDLTYVKKIIDLAKLCNYKDNQLIETVVDVIQAHATNPRVRKTGIKVLRKRGSITDLLDKVRECEMEQMNDINFARTHQQNSQVQPSALVAAVSNSSYHNNGPRMGGFHRGNSLYHQKYWGMQSGRGTSRLTPSRFSSNRPSGGRREPCGRCTSNYHSSENCHAISKRCRNCHTVGHIERACRQGIQDKTKRRAEEEEAGSPAIKTRKIAAIMDSNNTPETTSDKEIVSDIQSSDLI